MVGKKREPMTTTVQQGTNNRKLKSVHFPRKIRGQNLRQKKSKSNDTSDTGINELINSNSSTQLPIYIVSDEEVKKQNALQEETEELPVYKGCKSPEIAASKNIGLMPIAQKDTIKVDLIMNVKNKHMSQKEQTQNACKSNRRCNMQSSHCHQNNLSNNSLPKNICAAVQFQDNREEYLTKDLNLKNNSVNIMLHRKLECSPNKGVEVLNQYDYISMGNLQKHLDKNTDKCNVIGAPNLFISTQNVDDENLNKKVSQFSIPNGEHEYNNSTLKEGKTQHCELETNRFMRATELKTIEMTHITDSSLKDLVNENLNPQANVKHTILEKADESVYNKRSTLPQLPCNTDDVFANTLQSHPKVSKRGTPRKNVQHNFLLETEHKNNLEQENIQLTRTFNFGSDILLEGYEHKNNIIHVKESQDQQEESGKNHPVHKICELERTVETDTISVPEIISEDRHVITNVPNAILDENIGYEDCGYRMNGTQVLSPASLEIRNILATSTIKEQLNLDVNDRYGISGKKTAYYFRKITTDKSKHPEYKKGRRKSKLIGKPKKRSKSRKLNKEITISQYTIGKDVTINVSDCDFRKKSTKQKSEPKSNETISSNCKPDMVETKNSFQQHELKSDNVNLKSQIPAAGEDVIGEKSDSNQVNAATVVKQCLKRAGKRKRNTLKGNDASTSQESNEMLETDNGLKKKKVQHLLQRYTKNKTQMALLEHKSERLYKVDKKDKTYTSNNSISHVDLNRYHLKEVRINITRLEELPLIHILALLNKRKYNKYMAKAVKNIRTAKLNNESVVDRQANDRTTEDNVQQIPKYNKNDTARTTGNSDSDTMNNKQIIQIENANENRTQSLVSQELSLMLHSNKSITPLQQVPDEIFDVEESTRSATECDCGKQEHTKWITENIPPGIYYNNTSKTDFNHTLMEELNQSDEVFCSALMHPLQENTFISINKPLPKVPDIKDSEHSQEKYDDENEEYICINNLEGKENSPQKSGDNDTSLLQTGPFKDKHLPNSETSSEDDSPGIIAPHLPCTINNNRNENERKEEELRTSSIEIGLLPSANTNETHDKQINSNCLAGFNSIHSQLSNRMLKRSLTPPNDICSGKRLKIISGEKIVAKIVSDYPETFDCINQSYGDVKTTGSSDILDSGCCENSDSINCMEKDISVRVKNTTAGEKICIRNIQNTSNPHSHSSRISSSKSKENNNNEEYEKENEDDEGDDESTETEGEESTSNSDAEGTLYHDGQKPVRKWHCNLCNEKFALIRNYLRHKYYSHKDETSVHICDNCTKVITSVTMVNIHVCSNVTSWTCKRCNINFSNSLSLMEHNKRYHFETVGPHKCNNCHLAFLTKYMLEKHRAMQHLIGIDNNVNKRLMCLKEGEQSNFASSKTHVINQKKKLVPTVTQENDRLKTMLNMTKLNLTNIFLLPNTNELRKNQTKDQGITFSLWNSKQEFGCELCDLMRLSKSEMKLHLIEEHNICVRICELCGDFYVLTRAINHLIERHIVFDNSVLKNAHSFGQGATNLQKITQDENIPCELLTILGATRFRCLEQYRELFKKREGSNYFFCETCLEEYLSIDGYVFHHLKTHDTNCLLCNVEFTESGEAVHHKIETHKSIASYLWAVQKMVRSVEIAENYSRTLDRITLRLNKVHLSETNSQNAELISPEDTIQWEHKLWYLYTKIEELKDECRLRAKENVSAEPSATCSTVVNDNPTSQSSDRDDVGNITLHNVNSSGILHVTQSKNTLSNREEIPIIVLTENDLEMYKDDIKALSSRIHSSCNIFPEEYYTKLLVAYMNHMFR